MGLTSDGSDHGVVQAALKPETRRALLFKVWLQTQIA
jgi:hypothetical protein